MSGCSYDDIIIQVSIFDPYMQHYRYNNSEYSENDSNLDNEPTLKIVNKILEKINNSKHRDYADNLVDVLYDSQTEDAINDSQTEDATNDGMEYIDLILCQLICSNFQRIFTILDISSIQAIIYICKLYPAITYRTTTVLVKNFCFFLYGISDRNFLSC